MFSEPSLHSHHHRCPLYFTFHRLSIWKIASSFQNQTLANTTKLFESPLGFSISPNYLVFTQTVIKKMDSQIETIDSNGQSSVNTSLLQMEPQRSREFDLGFAYNRFWYWVVLVSPCFLWGTAMVAQKEVIPKAGPFFVSAVRLIPSGLILVGFAQFKLGKNQPRGIMAWFSILLFAIVHGSGFQGFLAEGLLKTSAGLASVIINAMPLTVAILAAIFFGESIGMVGAVGLIVGVIGLLVLEVPALFLGSSHSTSLWGNGEWWMLLSAQCMAVGTVMVRWVSKYSDPVMATGWHMVIGGLPLLMISILDHEPAIDGRFKLLTAPDILALVYISIFGSAISYGLYFYIATRGSLTKLSSLTYLTPMFATIFGYIFLGEKLSAVQLVGALVTLLGVYMVNFRSRNKSEGG